MSPSHLSRSVRELLVGTSMPEKLTWILERQHSETEPSRQPPYSDHKSSGYWDLDSPHTPCSLGYIANTGFVDRTIESMSCHSATGAPTYNQSSFSTRSAAQTGLSSVNHAKEPELESQRGNRFGNTRLMGLGR